MVERLGRYELVKHIGSGGMADVFLAKLQGVEGFTRQLVLKRMRKELQHNAEAVRMFLDEARLCAKLHHPQIVQVFDLGEADGSYFIAMEHVDGPHLGRLARDCWRAGTPPPAVLGAYVVHRAADGLHFAHELRDPETGEAVGIVHRDVTPHNILLSRFGDVKVADFGVAKTLTRADTQTGVIKGKLAYLSPEQVRGEELDRRSDVFSLGIVLFEVLTGRRLFKDKSDIKTLQRITREDAPPPSRFNPDVDEELDRVCRTALSRDRDARYPTMRAFERALEAWITARETKHLKTALAQFIFQHGRLPPTPVSRETPPALADPTSDVDPERTELDAGAGRLAVHDAETMIEAKLPSTFGEGTAVTLSGARVTGAHPRRADSGISLDTRKLQALKTNLTPQGTRFVGRAADLERLHDVFESGARLVTLHGPAGTGKTRLALRYAERELRRLSLAGGGAYLADLTEARSIDGICTQVASALGVPLVAETPDEDNAGVVGRVLEGRGELLLVLDNFEQVVQLGKDTITPWLHAAPSLRVIVTSRELLRLPGEHTLEVTPLPLASKPSDGKEPLPSEALELFLDRARAADPEWKPTAADREVIADIVQSLDGLPLAIELAAARIPVLKPRQLRERLTRRFDVLRGGARDARPRQATLRSALDWSWELLSAVEQHALAECSVFRGGFDLEAAEAVIDLTAISGAPWVLDVLQALRDKSLLVAYSAPDFPDEARFLTYESIREYAAEKLARTRGEEAALGRHAEHYLARATTWAREAHGHQGKTALARLRTEHQNLLAIHQRARPPLPSWATPEHALLVALVCEPLYDAQGPRQEQLALLDEALYAQGPAGDGARRARGLAARGRARRRLGRVSESRADFAEALRLSRAAGAVGQEGRVLRDLGMLASDEGRLDDARRNYEDALALHRAVGDERDEAVTRAYLAFLCEERGQLDDAKQHFEASLSRLRASGDRALCALVLGNYAGLEQELGDLPGARAHYEEAILALRELRQPTFIGPFLGSLATLLHEQGLLAEAIEQHEAAFASMRETGNLRYEGLMLAYLAAARAERGERAEAARLLDVAETKVLAVGDPRHVACARLCRGFLSLADARAALTASDGVLAQRLLDEVSERLDEARRPAAADDVTPGGGPSHAESSDEVRRALRLLVRARDVLQRQLPLVEAR